MRMTTHAENRRAMVDAISERLGMAATYAGPPSFAYLVGSIRVERDGTLVSESCEDLEALKPFLLERGYIDPEPERMNITLPVKEPTVELLKNLTHMLYSKQYLLGKATGRQAIHIPDLLINRLREYTPEDLEAFTTLLDDVRAMDELDGFDFRDGQLTMTFPFAELEPLRWEVYASLMNGMVEAARTAKRVAAERQEPENEKYAMRGWLLRLGFKGADGKPVREVMMEKLTGYAAFKTADQMDRHKAKYADLRRAEREARRAEAHEAE